jgi:hypothetical protein
MNGSLDAVRDAKKAAGAEFLRRLVSARQPNAPAREHRRQVRVPLAPSQLYMLNRDDLIDRDQVNLCEFYECTAPLLSQNLAPAVQRVCEHHAALRAKFHHDGQGWQQVISDQVDANIVAHIDLSGVKDSDVSDRIEAKAADLQRSLNLAGGPLLRVAHFDLGAGRSGRLLVLVHHVLVDGYSLSALLGELFSTLRRLRDGSPLPGRPEPHGFEEWTGAVAAYWSRGGLQRDASFWLEQPWADTRPLSAGSPVPLVTGEIRYLNFAFDAATTARLVARAARDDAHLVDLMAAVASRIAADWTGSQVISFALWDHGRTPLAPAMDLSRQVGYFAHYWPLALDLAEARSDGDLVRLMRRRRTGGPPRFGFKLARYSGCEDQLSQAFKAIPIPEIHINFLGRYRSGEVPGPGFKRAAESYGPLRNPRNWDHFRIVGINGYVQDGALRINWSYSDAVYRAEEIEGPATALFETLMTIAGGEN